MVKLVPGATTRWRPASGRPGSTLDRTQAARMNLFVFVRILFQYLERVDRPALLLAKEVLKDCERKHKSRDSKYKTLADAVNERVRDAVGEAHWTRGRKIHKQLMLNQQRKKLKAMQQARQRGNQHHPSISSQKSSQEQLQSLQQRRTSDDAAETAENTSAASQQASSAPSLTNLFSAAKCADQQMEEGNTNDPAQMPNIGGQLSPTVTNNEAGSIPRQESGG